MRLFISLSAALILAVAALTACNSTDGSGSGSAAKTKASPSSTAKPPATTTQPTPPPQQGDGVRRVTTAELKEAVDKGTAIVVDVRPAEQYKAGHIKGALHIPEAEIVARSGELPRDKMIVTYCS